MKIDVTLHLTLTVPVYVYDFGHPASRFSPAGGPQYDIDMDGAKAALIKWLDTPEAHEMICGAIDEARD